MTTADTKKEQERANLHKAIWQAATDLVHGGGVTPVQFKSYVIGMLFYRFVSENLVNYINSDQRRVPGNEKFDYSDLDNSEAEFGRDAVVKAKGFFMLPSELFANVRKEARSNENLNDTLSGIFRNIELSAKGEDSESDFKGLFDDVNVNSPALGPTVNSRNKKLVKLLDTIGNLDLGNFQENTIDLFGDAYEYLMSMYATQSGKKGGEFYTPQEVSQLLANITVIGKKSVNKVYDPACGSGSLLLKFAKVLGKDNVRQGFFGQEINIETYNLCRINMFLHDIEFEKFNIAHGDTLTEPEHWDDEPFDAIVSNPPFALRWEGDANPLLINDPRFSPAGVLAPKSRADLAFVMHCLSWLSTSGTAAIVEFPGVLYAGGANQKIRKYLVDNNYIDTVIQLPADLFYGVSISTCIIVLKKNKKDNSILFIDASDEFIRTGTKNKLTSDNQDKILRTYTIRQDVEQFARLVSHEEIAANEYTISVSNFIEKAVPPEPIDIKKLNADLIEIVTKQKELRDQIDKIVADIEGTQNA